MVRELVTPTNKKGDVSQIIRHNQLKRYFQLYNRERLHESLGYLTPHEVYFGDGKNNDGEAYRLIHQIQPIFVS